MKVSSKKSLFHHMHKLFKSINSRHLGILTNWKYQVPYKNFTEHKKNATLEAVVESAQAKQTLYIVMLLLY